MALKVKEVIKIMEELAPPEYAEDFDNCGLLVGDENQVIDKVLIALDATMEVIDNAIENDVEMIITHHPIIFSKMDRVNNQSIEGRKIIKLIKNSIPVYSAHTNLDKTYNGINDVLASKLGLTNTKMFGKKLKEFLYKIVVFIPKDHVNKVRNAMCNEGAGHFGNYSNCSFYTEGIGTFKPLEGSNPFIGARNHIEKVEEVRLETIVTYSKLSNVISAMIKSHPYEEVAYDVYKTEQKVNPVAFGRIGELEEVTVLADYAEKVKESLNLNNIHIIGNEDKKIKRVAICSGSGMSEYDSAVKEGAHVFITGDVKYHQAVYANELGIPVIDATHFGTENIIVDSLGDYLNNKIGKSVKVVKDTTLINPIKTI